MNFNELDFNDEFAAAFEALENTSGHLFITGKAGTGKSTLLQYFRHKTRKNIAVLAPTGVSSINIKGQTIHSFFQFRPDITPQTVGDIVVRKRQRHMYAKLETIVIDEVSMVRADLLDCMDVLLKLYGPHHDRPFGGVQMIFFGDLFQLPPVVPREEDHIFQSIYRTPFFFSAKAFEVIQLKIMELGKIYRQKDEQFIHLLNAVRDNALGPHHLSAFNSRFEPKHEIPVGEFYITLTTTNALAAKVNTQQLTQLPGKAYVYQGIAAGEFDRKLSPNADTLEIKYGSQVMLLNNDQDKRWVNGSLGVVVAVKTGNSGDDIIMVKLQNGVIVDVKKHTWELYQYYFDETIAALSSKVMGQFTQYPLKLAWAVTIHKSQGQTFEKVIIDVGFGTFSHGQMYVALSRCTTLRGIILKQPLTNRNILLDERVVEFHRNKITPKAGMVAVALFIVCWLWPFLATAGDRDQEIAVALAQVQEQKAAVETWDGTHSDLPYVVLLNEYDTAINTDWSFDEIYHTRVRIQKDTGKELGQWPLPYNKAREEITDLIAFVETPDGKSIQATDIKDMPAYDTAALFADLRVKVVSLPQVSVGTVIDVTVKTKVKGKELVGHYWDELRVPATPTKYARHSYVFPKDLPIAFKSYKTDYKPLVEEKNGMMKYSFVFKHTKDYQVEEFLPPMDEVFGGLYMSSVKDWDAVADWYRGLMAKNLGDDAAITARVGELVKDKEAQKDKARAILEFIQDQFRYVALNFGDHMVEPHPTSETFKNAYGDCKDLTLLVKQMLKIAGIDAKMSLMSSEFNGNPLNGLPNPSAFEHVVLLAHLDGQEYVLDPQAKGFDFGQYPTPYDHAFLLVIEDAGYHFQNIPVATQDAHSLITASDITVESTGDAVYNVHVQLPIEASQAFRVQWAGTTDANKEKFFQSLESTFAQGGTMLSHDVRGLDSRYGRIEFSLKYRSPKAYPIVNDMILLKEMDQGNLPDFAAPSREYPIFFPANSLIKNTHVYHLPADFQVDSVPANYSLGIDFVSVDTAYATQENRVTVHTVYRLKRATVEAGRYNEVRDFYAQLSKKAEQYIVLKPNR